MSANPLAKTRATALLIGWMLLAGLPACRQRRVGPTPRSEARAGVPRPTLVVDAPVAPVGFDRPVRLAARIDHGPTGVRWTFRFLRIWGPPLRQLRVTATELRFRTRQAPRWTEAQRRDPSNLLPISAREAGRQVLRVTATGSPGGLRLERVVEVAAALPTAAWPRMAIGADHYLPGASEAWRLEGGRIRFARGPGTKPGRGTTRARAEGGGWHELVAPDGSAVKVRGGAWLGDADCGRVDCHPREHQGWRQTAHASIFTRGVSGRLDPTVRGRYERHCAACHTVGYQPGAPSDGFTHRVERSGWRLGERRAPVTWARLPTGLKRRANVQCESCHGPGWFYVGYGVDICAQCHDHPPQYRRVSQLRTNRMPAAERRLTGRFAIRSATRVASGTKRPAERHACQSCHTAAGYLASLRGHRSGSLPGRDLATAPTGVTCAACHDPHSAGCARQLRLCGMVEIPGRTFDAGQGALCISCHNGEADVVHGPLLRPFVPGRPGRETASGRAHGQAGERPRAGAGTEQRPRDPNAAPHASQFQLLTSRGGKFLRLPTRAVAQAPNPHMLVPDSCVGCHVSPTRRQRIDGGHAFRLAPGRGPEAKLCTGAVATAFGHLARSAATEPCQSCHGAQPSLDLRARGDHDRDGKLEGLVTEVSGLLAELGRRISAHVSRLSAAGQRPAHLAIADERVVLADDACRPLRDRRGEALTLPADRATLRKAGFNALMVLRDGSGGLHNPRYVTRLLRQSIDGLAQ